MSHDDVQRAASMYRARFRSLSSSQYRATGMAVSWEMLFFYDALIFVLTLWRNFREGNSRAQRNDILTFVVRDGKRSLYYRCRPNR